MVLRCVVCKKKTSSTVSLLKFPQDTAVSGLWAAFCKINLEETKPSTRLCSLHFSPDDFKFPLQDGKKIILKSGAIPTVLLDSKDTSTDQSRTRKYGLTDCVARRNCCVCGSVALSTHNNNLHFYRFPHDTTRKEEWLHSLEIAAANLKPWHRVCSRHFIDANPKGVPVRSVVNDLAETRSSFKQDDDIDPPHNSLQGNEMSMEMLVIKSEPGSLATPLIPVTNSGSTLTDLETPRRERRCLQLRKLQLSNKIIKLDVLTAVQKDGLISESVPDTLKLDRGRSRLKPGVVPSILPGPGYLRKCQDLRPEEMGRRYCCIDSCRNRKDSSSLLSIFLPPKDPELFAKWVEMIKPHRRLPVTRTTGVCELHFQPGDILREFVTKMQDGTVHKLARGRVSLAPGIYPTIFGRDFKKKKKKSSCIEVKAPSSSKKEVTYIFDVGDDEPEEEDVEIVHKKSKVKASPRKGKKGETSVKRKRGRYKKTSKVLDDQKDSTEGDSDDVIECNETLDDIIDDSDDRSGSDDNFDDAEDDRDSNGCHETLDDNKGSPADPVAANPPEPVKSDDNYQGAGRVEQKTKPPEVVTTDLRQILNNDEDPEKSVINNVEAFSRLCRSYIVSKVNKRGRKSDLEMHGPPPEKKSRKSEEEVFLYPTTNNLDVMTLVYNIDRVKYPSDNWFCTIKDGAPAFLCWGDGYKINKKVIFDSQNLDPTIMIGENEVKLSEVIRPRSIKEVGSILKLADSVQLCSRYNDMVRPYTNCKGYFFRAQTDDPSITECILCRNQNKLQPYQRKVCDRVTYEEICQAAESLVENRELWSYTIIGTAVVFLGWWKQYRIDKLYIVNRDVSTKLLMGDQFVTIEEIKYIKTLDDIAVALDFLSKCRKCYGINTIDTKLDTRRAEDCMGFVAGESPFARVSRCKTCCNVRNKVRLRNHRQRMKGQFVRCAGDMYPPLKLRTKTLDRTSFEEELAVEDDELSDEGWLVDVLEKVTFPSISWSYVVVDNSIIFQNWGSDSFVVTKKIIINPDLNVQIYVMDNHVEIEAVQSVENVDDVMRLLNIVECIKICEGVDDTNSSKSEGCTGYYYDPDANNAEPDMPKRCPKCSREYLIYTRREQRWMKKIAMGQADLEPCGEITLNAKQASVKVEVAENIPSNNTCDR